MAETKLQLVVSTKGTKTVDGLTSSLKTAESQAGKTQQSLSGLSASTSKASAANNRVARTSRNAASGIQKQGKAAKRAGSATKGLIASVGKLALAYASLKTAQAAIQTGIRRAESERRIKFLAREYGEVEQLQNAATASAKKFGISQTEANQAIATTYARLRPVGTSLAEITSVYNGFNTAAKLSGASTTESAGAFRQLAQALGSGTLRGDEFNSVAEQVPAILTAVSKETGIAQGKLRDYAADGKITADVVIRALQRIEREGAAQLTEALGGPEQAVKDFQNAAEDAGVALTEAVIPELSKSFRELAGFIRSLEPEIKFIGGLLADMLTDARLVIQAIKGQGNAVNTLRAGRMPKSFRMTARDGSGTVADKEFREFFGKDAYEAMRVRAKKEADRTGKEFMDVFQNILMGRLKIIDWQAKRDERRAKDAKAAGLAQQRQSQISSLKSQLQGQSSSSSSLTKSAAASETEKALKPTTISIVELGKRLEALGYTVKEHPAFGGVTPGVHAPNSYHKYGEAIDVTDWRDGDWMGRTKNLQSQLQNSGAGFAELIGPNSAMGGHDTHIHIAAAQGQVQLTPELAAVLGLPGGAERGATALQTMNTESERLRTNLQSAREQMQGLVESAESKTQSLQDNFDDQQLARRLEMEGLTSEQIAIQVRRSAQLREIDRERTSDLQELNELAAEGKVPADEVKGIQQDITAEYEKQAGLVNRLADAEMNRAQSGGKVQQKIKEYGEQLADTEGMIVSLAGTVEGELAGAMSSALTGLIDGTKTAEEAFADMFKNIGKAFIDMATQMIAKALVMKALGILTGGGGGLGGGGGGVGSGAGSFFGGLSFEGGGYTGDGSRSGGVDGQGGFPAILHPQETVVDHFGAAKSAMNASTEQAAASSSGPAFQEESESESVTTGTTTIAFETYSIGGMDVVTRDEAIRIGQESAKQAKAQVFSDMRNKPSTRRQLGMV